MTLEKTVLMATVLWAMSLVPTLAQSGGRAAESSPFPPATETAEEAGIDSMGMTPLRALEHLLHMSDEELAELQMAIARVRAMDTAQREEMLSKIAAFREINPGRRHELMQRIRRLPPEARRAFAERFSQRDAAEAAALRERLRRMTPEERRAFRERRVNEALETVEKESPDEETNATPSE
mgnify:CR=1 FL=1